MTFAEALELIQSNLEAPEVKAFLKKFDPLASLTRDNVSEFVEKNEILKSYRDSFYAKGLETWKANNLKKHVDEEIAKINPPESPEAKKIRELEERLNEAEKKARKEALRTFALSKLSEKKLPTDLIDHLIGDDEQTTTTILQTFEKALDNYKKSVVDEILKEHGREPKESRPDLHTHNPWKKENWNLTEQMKITKTNPELAKTLAKEAGVKSTP